MALNFSHRPIFPGGLSEDNLVAPMRIGNGYRVEGIQEKGAGGGDGFGNASWHDADNCFDYGRERRDMGTTQDSVSKDILDLLPSDPFGMDISTTFTAIKGWLQDLEVDNGGYRMEELREGNRFQMYAELEFLCNNAMWFHTLEPRGFGGCSWREVGAPSCNFVNGSDCSMDDKLGFGSDYEDVGISSWSGGGDTHMDDGNFFGADELSPHPAMSFCLGYLGLSDLLVVERVCKSLRSTVRGDPLLWRRIHIDQPLNERITDDVLLQLSDRAQGNLQCLSLVECTRITDDGLRRVLEANPKLTKLSVPGCTRLSIEGVVSTLKAFKSMGTQGVKHLHIGGLYGVTQNHFEELKLLMGTDSQCRACTLCIARCSQCGHCINDSEYEETFCLELLCSSCSKLLIKCSERPDGSVGSTESVVPHEHS
ncbi:hypothetical protein PIB30_010019 [Stylosanthes scabra]|uniref:F-box domain-containing protein n=1 Tax=Stylosanthes scabra TaxID=79078 RepID=A0ABU6V761_9FABA|nr:hypothetical protein [Stylosanthes scabra]